MAFGTLLSALRNEGMQLCVKSQPADYPTEELLEFMGLEKEDYLAIIYPAAIDDSADRDRNKFVLAAVLIGNRDQWLKLRVAWRKRLAQDEIAYFRSSQCNHLRNQFHKYRDLQKYPPPTGRQIADKIRSDLDGIIHDCQLVGMGCIIPVSLYQRFQQDPTYEKAMSKDIYHWAVQTVWSDCAEGMKSFGKGKHIVTFAHDDCSNFETLRQLYKGYKRKNKGHAKVMGDFVPLDDKLNPPIQAADVIADVTHKVASTIKQWEPVPKVDFERLRKRMYTIAVWDERFAKMVLGAEL